MDAQQVTAHARERLGMELQAATLYRPHQVGGRCPEVWSLMTERGYFWLVEEAGAVELFRATRAGAVRGHTLAVHCFLELHPEVTEPPPAVRTMAPLSFDCQRCEAPVSLSGQSRAAEAGLCTRCSHAKRERLRYQSDPEYRARCLAARRRRTRRGDGA